MREPLMKSQNAGAFYPYRRPDGNLPYDYRVQPSQLPYSTYACPGKSFPPISGQHIGYGWLLIPSGIGILGALLWAGSLPPVEEDCYQQEQAEAQTGDQANAHEIAAIVLYTAFSTLTFSLFVYFILKERRKELTKAFAPLFVGLSLQLLLYGVMFLLVYRLDPSSFMGHVDSSFRIQLFTFIYFSIATFSTGGDGGITPHGVSSKSIEAIEYLLNIFIFVLGIVLLTSN